MTDTDSFPDVFSQPNTTAPLATHDLKAMKLLLDQINHSANNVTRTLLTGFGAATTSGKSFNETLIVIAQSLARIAIREGSRVLAQGLVNGLSGLFANALGGNAATTHFAQGGVIASPAYFANGGTIGLMGERGAEAVIPLSRGSDGRLGVVAQGEAVRPVVVTVNIATQDAESFRRTEAQITGALARAVARGQRNL